MPRSPVQTIHAVELMGEETAWLGGVREARRSRWVRSGNAGQIKVQRRTGCGSLGTPVNKVYSLHLFICESPEVPEYERYMFQDAKCVSICRRHRKEENISK